MSRLIVSQREKKDHVKDMVFYYVKNEGKRKND